MNMEKELEEYVNELKGKLPPPSEWNGDIVVPYGIYGYDYALGVPKFGSITFERDVHDGIVIGWKLKEVKP